MALNDAVPSSATDVFKRNAEDTDRLLNGSGSVTNRLGNQLLTWEQISQSHAAWNNRGAWVAATAYAINDIWQDGANWYVVLSAYTSGATAAADIAGPSVVVLSGNFVQGVEGLGFDEFAENKNLVYPVGSVEDLAGLVGVLDDQQISLKGWHPDSDVGGGILYWDAAKPKSEHNGGTVFSTTVPFSATTGDYLDGVGETDAGGSGCWVRLVNGMINAEWFGARNDDSVDNSLILRHIYKFHSHVFFTSGFWRCDETVRMTPDLTLYLGNKAWLVRKTLYSISNEPVLFINGSNVSIIGSGQRNSGVRSESPCFGGVIKLGQSSMSDTGHTITYCTLRDFGVDGGRSFGEDSVRPTVGIYMPSPQINENANYFHTVSGLIIERVNVGMWLQGWANGNNINNIQGYQVGNQGMPSRAAFILCDGALDNNVSNVFLHASPDTTLLEINSFDNTGVAGGSLHEPVYNNFTNLSCEQGGVNAKGVVVTAGSGNYIQIADNAAGGNYLFPLFNKHNNKFISPSSKQGCSNGYGWTRSYSSQESVNITLSFNAPLTGAGWYNATIEVLFCGMELAGSNEQVSKYIIPIRGNTTYGLSPSLPPVNLHGVALFITEVSNSSDSVTLNISAQNPMQKVSLLASCVSSIPCKLD